MFASDDHESCSVAPSYCESDRRRSLRRSVIRGCSSTCGVALCSCGTGPEMSAGVCLTWGPQQLADPDHSEQPDSTAAEPLEGPPGPRRSSHSSAGRISTRTHAHAHARTCCALIHTWVFRKKKKSSERTTGECSDLSVKLCPGIKIFFPEPRRVGLSTPRPGLRTGPPRSSEPAGET